MEGPQSRRCDRPERLPFAVWLLVQRDLGVQNASQACAQQVDAAEVGVPTRGLLCKGFASGQRGAPSEGASRSPGHNRCRTTGSDRRAISTALSLLTGAALLLQRPRQPPRSRCRRAVRFLILDTDTARPAGGRGQRPHLHCTPIRPPRNKNLCQHGQPAGRTGLLECGPHTPGQPAPRTPPASAVPTVDGLTPPVRSRSASESRRPRSSIRLPGSGAAPEPWPGRDANQSLTDLATAWQL